MPGFDKRESYTEVKATVGDTITEAARVAYCVTGCGNDKKCFRICMGR